MDLKQMTNEKLILLDFHGESKKDVIDTLVNKLYEQGYLESKEDFVKAVMKREELSETGLEKGLAIPHGKSKSVKKAVFAVARLNNKLKDWESIDETNEVDLVFLLAIPEEEAGSTHLKLLAELSTALMNDNFIRNIRTSKTSKEFINALGHKEKAEKVNKDYDKTVLAVTACPTGIAHTYMSAEALEKAGKEMGIRVIVEKQGANGIEDRHTKELIEKADGIILATDIAAKDVGRFNGKPYIKTKVAEPLKNAKGLIERVLNNPDGTINEENGVTSSDNSKGKQSILSEMTQSIMTGISYMIPIIVAAGLMMGIAKLGAMGFGIVNEIGNAKYAVSPNQIIKILHYLDAYGSMIFKFMYPIFSAYVAYSIADRGGLLSGFIGGAFATGLHYTFWEVKGGIPSGFLGALVLGLVAGYVSKLVNEKIKLSKNFAAMKPMFFIPAISVLAVFFINFYIVDPVFGSLNLWLKNTIQSASGAGTYSLCMIIAAATAFDLGGPINKAAGAIAIGLAADHIFPLTARVLSIVIPPMGLGLATILDKYIVKRRVFDENLRFTGRTSLLLGFLAISEGAIPFMLKNPLITIPINIIGAMIGSVVAVALGAVQWNPLPAIWGWPLVENLWAYLVGLLSGVLFIALTNIFVRASILKKKES
ncbi:fructose-specific PTS transporter subunit EIIC [Clostridium sp. Marseille-Q2269]|uniref:fructose-specific PTS transporter subunit EIIC n=1 Tax=Clostridium sp. Marseille-Q2269 TaxID=2942205 RepID=UPI0020746664|nr:fructose-specific PTS transporter subunit EIIC [Clostridium sp. Marseille-Q2269]